MLMQIVAWIASLLVFLAFFMKTMVPLRMVRLLSANVVFISYALLGLYYGIFEKVYPIFMLHLLLLPLNIIRLYQIKQLVRKIGEASGNEPAVEYLIPYMQKGTYVKGQVLFQKGDAADKIYFIQAGGITIPEIKRELTEGALFGEVGIFAPHKTRSASAICAEHAVIYSIHIDKVLELYYQNPKFGFFIVRLLSSYASENKDRDAILELRNR